MVTGTKLQHPPVNVFPVAVVHVRCH